MRLPPQEYLKECFDYDPETGELRWKVRPMEHFQCERIGKGWNTKYAGTLALAVLDKATGQWAGGLKYEGLNFHLSRQVVIWIWMTGKEPVGDVIHRDHDHTNNRWVNLQLATRAQVRARSLPDFNKQIPYKGVSHTPNGKFRARITKDQKLILLGHFDTPELASAAYAAKAQELYGEFART